MGTGKHGGWAVHGGFHGEHFADGIDGDADDPLGGVGGAGFDDDHGTELLAVGMGAIEDAAEVEDGDDMSAEVDEAVGGSMVLGSGIDMDIDEDFADLGEGEAEALGTDGDFQPTTTCGRPSGPGILACVGHGMRLAFGHD